MAKVSPYSADVSKALDHLAPTTLSDCKILVAGATGLIGGCLVDMLMSLRCQVYALGRNRQRARRRFADYWDADNFHFLEGDVTAPLRADVAFHYIIHAASNASPSAFRQQPVEVIMSNIYGVRNLMDYGLSHGMRRMLYVSSGEVYGEGSGAVFTETDSGYVDCATPRACYPSSKRTAETLCAAYAAEYGADVVIARPCHTYGPFFTESDDRVYAQFLRNVLRGEDIVLKSRGEQFRSWIYVVDCAAALLRILADGQCGCPYNVADSRSCVTIRALAEQIARCAGREVRFDIPDDAQKGNTTPITRAVFSTARLEALGWQPLTPLADGISHTLETLLNTSPGL